MVRRIHYTIEPVRSIAPEPRFRWQAQTYDLYRGNDYTMQSDMTYESDTQACQDLLMNMPRIRDRFDEIDQELREEGAREDERRAQLRGQRAEAVVIDELEPAIAGVLDGPQEANYPPPTARMWRTNMVEAEPSAAMIRGTELHHAFDAGTSDAEAAQDAEPPR